MSNVTVDRRGVSFLGMLQVLFIGLKLGNVISWSWLWVLTPIWGTAALIVSVLLFCLIVAMALGRN